MSIRPRICISPCRARSKCASERGAGGAVRVARCNRPQAESFGGSGRAGLRGAGPRPSHEPIDAA